MENGSNIFDHLMPYSHAHLNFTALCSLVWQISFRGSELYFLLNLIFLNITYTVC